MATIDEALNQLEAQLQQCGEQLDALVARVEGADPEARSERQQRIAALGAKHKEAQSALAAVQAVDREKTATDVDGTWSSVEAKFFGSQ